MEYIARSQYLLKSRTYEGFDRVVAQLRQVYFDKVVTLVVSYFGGFRCRMVSSWDLLAQNEGFSQSQSC